MFTDPDDRQSEELMRELEHLTLAERAKIEIGGCDG